MQQKDDAHEGDDETLFKQGVLEGLDGTVDQVGAVVNGLHADAIGQSCRNLSDLVFDVGDHFEGVLPVAGHDDASDDFAFAIELVDSSALVRGHLHAGDVANQHRRSLVAFDSEVLNVAGPAQVSLAAHHVFGLRHFDDPPAHVAIGVADHVGYFR
jgi:hypothetical protein